MATTITNTSISTDNVTPDNVTTDGLVVDTNTLHVDATNNRVGINTTNGPESLNTTGNIRFQTNNKVRLEYLNSTGAYITGTTGGAALGFEYFSGGADHEIFFETHNGGVSHREVMRIDKDGYVTKPYQPFFAGTWNQSAAGYVTGTYGNLVNNGGFTQSNGKIYVPTAGWYFINAYGIATDSFDTRVVANTTGSSPFLFDFRQSTYASGTHHGCGNGRVVYLNSGDYVGIYRLSGTMYTSAGGNNPHNLISIMLMG